MTSPMMDFAAWVQATAFFTALRESWYMYPVILSLHMLGIALFGGLVFVSNLVNCAGSRWRNRAGYSTSG